MCWMITTKLERVASVMSRSEVPAAHLRQRVISLLRGSC